MGHGRRVGNHRLHTTKALGQTEEFDAIHKATPRLGTSGQFEGNHATETRHLLLGKLVLGMRSKSWVKHLLDLWMRFKICGDLPGRFGMSRHA